MRETTAPSQVAEFEGQVARVRVYIVRRLDEDGERAEPEVWVELILEQGSTAHRLSLPPEAFGKLVHDLAGVTTRVQETAREFRRHLREEAEQDHSTRGAESVPVIRTSGPR